MHCCHYPLRKICWWNTFSNLTSLVLMGSKAKKKRLCIRVQTQELHFLKRWKIAFAFVLFPRPPKNTVEKFSFSNHLKKNIQSPYKFWKRGKLIFSLNEFIGRWFHNSNCSIQSTSNIVSVWFFNVNALDFKVLPEHETFHVIAPRKHFFFLKRRVQFFWFSLI